MKHGALLRDKARKALSGALTSALAIVLAMLVGLVVIRIAGADPIEAYKQLIYGAFGSPRNFAETLTKATPLLIAGLGLSISFRCNLVNVGADGQMVMGGIFSTLAAFLLTGAPPFVVIPAAILAGFAGGALLGLIPAVLKAKLGTSEVIITIMLNYIATLTLSFLLDGLMKEPGSYYPQSAPLEKSAWLPLLIPGTRLHLGFLLGIALIIAYYILVYRLPLGFKIRTVGYNPRAARYAGMKPARYVLLAMVLSGGLAGIAGMSEIFGIQHRLFNDFTAGYGFDAVAVALLGKFHPAGVLLSALYFGAVRVGANAMQGAMQVPVSVSYIIQGVSVLFILTDQLLHSRIAGLVKREKQALGALRKEES